MLQRHHFFYERCAAGFAWKGHCDSLIRKNSAAAWRTDKLHQQPDTKHLMKFTPLKTNVCSAVFLAICLLASLASAQQQVTPINLVLLNSVELATLSNAVQLQAQDPKDGCRYWGKVEDRKGIKESAALQLLRQATGDASTFSIAIQRKVCGTREEAVSLRVPLKTLATGVEYPKGTVVQAIEDK